MKILHWMAAIILFFPGCDDRPKPKLAADKSQLKAATDVFWALDEKGYIIAKEKPVASRHGCKPSEYLAKKDDAIFRISVFHCGDSDQAKELVEHPKTRYVDSLLRNHGEGGVIQRGPLEIIVRLTHGEEKAVKELLDLLGSL